MNHHLSMGDQALLKKHIHLQPRYLGIHDQGSSFDKTAARLKLL